ncbi:MAG TPA: lasso peptide biosynthesis B2 protein [Gemmatimonadales bacterium]
MLRLRVLLFAALVPLLVRLPLPVVERLVRRRGAPPARTADSDRIVRYVEHAVGLPGIRRSCLTRGVTLYYFLTRAGVDVSLCFGVGTLDGVMGAHCWLVKDGEPYLERGDVPFPFVPMHVIPAPGA